MQTDLVNRIDVLRELAPFRGYIPNRYLDKLIEIMTKLPPAEQPMSALEYERSCRRFAWVKAQQTGEPVELSCAIGDDKIDGISYSDIVALAREFVITRGGFEKFAEWGLV